MHVKQKKLILNCGMSADLNEKWCYGMVQSNNWHEQKDNIREPKGRRVLLCYSKQGNKTYGAPYKLI